MPPRTLASPLPRRRSGKKRRHARITVEDIDSTLRKEEARLFPKSGGRGKGVSRIDDALWTDEVCAFLPRRPSLLALRGRARLVHELRVSGWGAHVLPVGAQLSADRVEVLTHALTDTPPTDLTVATHSPLGAQPQSDRTLRDSCRRWARGRFLYFHA